MKRLYIFSILSLLTTVLGTTSCQRSSDEVWNDTKSAGSHVKRGVNTLGGKHGESRQVKSQGEFAEGAGAGANSEFIGIEDDRISSKDEIPQSRETPGELGSSIPGIDGFTNPADDPELALIFQNVHFEYNSHLLEGDNNLRIVQKVADYMKAHPRMYIFVEGHCDKRGPAAYNFALGANRANAVRVVLVNEGISPDHIFTVSYGKERLLVPGDAEEEHQLNRRCQFKVYENNS